MSNLSVSHPLDSSPGRRALGKEISFRSNTRCCDKTSPPQSLPLSGEVASSEAKMSERLYRAAPAFSAQSKGVLCPTSQSRFRSTAPLKRGAIDKEISFRSNTRCCDKTSPPQSLPLSGEVASSEAKMSERLYRAAPALFRSLERRPLSNLSVSLPLDSSPGRRALGKEGSFSMKPTGAYWKTSRNAKASHFGRGGTAKP